MTKHVFRYGNTPKAGCLKCGQSAAYHMYWREEDDKVMDVIDELQKHYDSMYTPGPVKPALVKAINTLKELTSKIPPDWHGSPRRIGVVEVSTIWLARFLKLPPDHYVERVWQDGNEEHGGNFHVVIIGPKCPQISYGKKIPKIEIVMHSDKEYSSINKLTNDKD